MLRRAALALAAVPLLFPGNLLAAVVQASAGTCEGQGCGCPAPDQDGSSPALKERCCCEAQPAPAPQDKPFDPLLTPKGSPALVAALDVLATAIPGASSLHDRSGERPAYLAQAPPDPLFLRYHSLRL